MTIYILDNDPKKCAEYLDDKSLGKVIRDIAKVLCNVHHILNSRTEIFDIKRKIVDVPLEYIEYEYNAPIAQWTDWIRECKANYLYLIEFGIISCNEHAFRFYKKGKIHPIVKYENVISWSRDNVPNLPEVNIMSLRRPLIMPNKYKEYDISFKSIERALNSQPFDKISESYRNYYQAKLISIIDKYRENGGTHAWPIEIEWTKREKPEWLKL